MSTCYRCDDCGWVGERPDWHRHRDCQSERIVPFEVIGPEDVPDGTSGNITVSREVFEQDTNVGTWRAPTYMKAGQTLIRLMRGGSLWMSNTPFEVGSQRFHIPYAMGNPVILIGGLGLGSVLEYIQRNTVPSRVVVVERDPDVIAVVGPTYSPLPWLEIVEGDIFEYGKVGPRRTFDVAWVDVWGDYNGELWPEYKRLRRSLLPLMRPGGGRINLWIEDEIRWLAGQGR